MKYEELNKIEVTRKIWPAGKTVQIDAYEAKYVDEALDEIVKWYSTAKEELENLKTKYTEDTAALKKDMDVLQGELVKKEKIIKENTETICEYKIQTAKTVQELAEMEDEYYYKLKRMKEKVDKTGIEVECFIHGAMCSSYSGRCVLSNYFTNRDANRGGCTPK